MNTLRTLAAAATCLGALSFTSPASAVIVWSWSIDLFSQGIETGTFTTDGTEPTAGRFNISAFTLDSSTNFPNLVGKPFRETQPVQGFIWNGTAPTQFFRSSGSLTTGLNFFATSGTLGYNFRMDTSNNPIGDIYNPISSASLFAGPLTLTPVAAPVPEPASVALMALGVLAVLGATSGWAAKARSPGTRSR